MPSQRQFPGIWLLLCVFVACALALPARAVDSDPRNVDATGFGQRITLGPEWLFSPGDNPAWASPGFDDSAWATVSTEKQLFDYGYHDLRYAWYRIHIHLRPGARNLAVGFQGVVGSYEIFANGVRVGGKGPFPPGYRFTQFSLAAYPVPDGIVTAQGDLVIAIRFGFNVTGQRGQGTSTPIYNQSSVYLLSRDSVGREISYADSQRIVPFAILAGLSLLTGLVALALFAALRTQREYLAAAVYMLAWSGYYGLDAWYNSSFSTFPRGFLLAVFFGLANAAVIEFVRLVLGLRRTRWILALEVIYFLAAFSSPLAATPFWPYYFGFAVFYLPTLFVEVFLAALLVRALLGRGPNHGSSRGNIEARILLPAVLLMTFADYWTVFNYLPFFFHFTPAYRTLPLIHLSSYAVSVLSFGDFLSFITVLLFLVVRTVGIASRHAKVASELEAAHTTQQLLLSRASQPTPGFHVESVYYPASEVGGDFFLVSTSPEGSLVAIVGDVSGKGLTAAMRVAMIVGVLRRENSWEPAEVLHNLNEALLTHAEAGFTTACCIRLDKNGEYTVANGGHIAPYIDGAQISTPPALPLGIVADQQYTQITGTLRDGQRLTLLSDGVVEARSSTGELFGFERTAALSTQPAEKIAHAAQAYGQEDDITVLTMQRTAPA